jgi:hypothetical protein
VKVETLHTPLQIHSPASYRRGPLSWAWCIVSKFLFLTFCAALLGLFSSIFTVVSFTWCFKKLSAWCYTIKKVCTTHWITHRSWPYNEICTVNRIVWMVFCRGGEPGTCQRGVAAWRVKESIVSVIRQTPGCDALATCAGSRECLCLLFLCRRKVNIFKMKQVVIRLPQPFFLCTQCLWG